MPPGLPDCVRALILKGSLSTALRGSGTLEDGRASAHACVATSQLKYVEIAIPEWLG